MYLFAGRSDLVGSVSFVAVAAACWATGVAAETITISTPQTVPVSAITDATGSIHVTSSGSVTTQNGGNHAIQPYLSSGLGAWTVNVDGSVKVLDADNEVYGVWLRGGGAVTVSSSGRIEGSRKGVVIDNGLADVQNDGLIYGKQIAVSIQSGGSVTNRGQLVGGVVFQSTSSPSIFVNQSSVTGNGGGFGVIMNAGGTFTNTGTVDFTNIGQGLWSRGTFNFTNSGTYRAVGDSTFAGPIYAALMQGGDATASNSGLIEGREVGVFAYQGTADITNSGTIRGLNSHAVALQTTGFASFKQFSGSVEGGVHGISAVTSGDTDIAILGGSVSGGLSSATGIGIRIGGGGKADVVVRDATVSGVAAAIQGGTGLFNLNLQQGSVVRGDIKLGDGDSNLEIDSRAIVDGDIDGQGGVNTLRLVGPGHGVLNGNIANIASLEMAGVGGIWTLTGSGSFAQGIKITAGELIVNGDFQATTTVGSGGLLQGIGTVGTTVVASGATVAPGNSIGTLHVDGDLTLAAGSTYDVEIGGSGASDMLTVSGTATLQGATVSVTALDPARSYRTGQTYTILKADGGVIGSFDPSVLSRSAFIQAQLQHLPNAVELAITATQTSFASVAATHNQAATGAALDRLEQQGAALALYNSVLALDAATARSTFDLLSGDIHASVKGALGEDSRYLRDAATTRLRSAFETVGATAALVTAYGPDGVELAPSSTPGFAVWGQGLGAWSTIEGDGNAAGLDRSTGGLLFGADTALGNHWRAGLLAGYSRTNFEADERAASADSDNYHLGFYAGGQWDAFGLRGGASYSWHSLSTDRVVAFPGFSNQLKSSFDAGTTQVFAEGGYRIDTALGEFEPFTNVAYVNVHTDPYGESGGAASLVSASSNTDMTFATFGVRAAADLVLGDVTAKARGMVGWRHAFGDVTPLSALAFANGDTFTIAGAPIGQDAAVVEAGLDFAISSRASIGVAYNGQFASQSRDNSFNARLAVSF